MKQVLASIISNDEIMPAVYLTLLEASQIASSAQPGQFVMVRCGEEYELPLRRPLSIHQIDNGKLAICSTWWEKVRSGYPNANPVIL